MLEFARGRKDGLVEDHVGGRQHEDLGIDEMALDEERGSDGLPTMAEPCL